MLTASWGIDLNGWVICYGWCQFIYGIGVSPGPHSCSPASLHRSIPINQSTDRQVGGEYPMTSTTALESGARGAEAQRDDKLHRGRNVVLAFLMQGESFSTDEAYEGQTWLTEAAGWGQLFNQGMLIILLLIFNGGGNPP